MSKVHAFTTRYDAIANVLTLPIMIGIPNVKESCIKTNGILDTGATNSVISRNVLDRLHLLPDGKVFVNTASEQKILRDTYNVDIYLKDDVRITHVTVTEGALLDGAECLIGMDIISLGDLTISNFNNQTWLSFRIPSLQHVDFVEGLQQGKPMVSQRLPSRNSLCPCGSGKKFKHCCGSNQ